MRRILVVAGRRLDDGTFSAVPPRVAQDDLEVFILYLVGRRAIPAWMHNRRFWRSRHAELDRTLDELSRLGLLSDGVATADEPVDAIGRALESFKPDEVINAVDRGGGGWVMRGR